MKNRDVIIIASQAWDIEIGSNCKNIALELAKDNRVLYVNPPLDRISVLKQSKQPMVQKRLTLLKKPIDALISVGSNLWTLYPATILESINWLPSGFLYNFLNKINNRRLAIQVKKASKILDFSTPIVFNDSFMFGGLLMKELLKPALHIYYIRDNLISQSYFKKHGTYLEPQLIEKSDLVFANSTYLQNYAVKYNNNSFYIGQGCDLEAFENSNSIAIPDILISIPYPKIGYMGYITSLRLDIELLRNIATQKPEWQIVLVGPTDQKFKDSGLEKLKNIHFLGAVPTNLMPNYIKGFDVCINPQLVNELTVGNYPRKIDEYLAMGKPVVATLTTTMEIFQEYTFLAQDTSDYLALIAKALDQQDATVVLNRKQFAKSHTWQESVRLMYEQINF